MTVKKYFYIVIFTLLGILVSFLIHAVIEIPAIFLLISDFERWGLRLSWETWESIHAVFAVVLFILGVIFGLRYGKHYWSVMYGQEK